MMFAFVAIVFSSLVTAATLPTTQLALRDVYSPRITHPVAGSTWFAGEMTTVTWDTTDAPVNITNPNGRVVLGQKTTGDDGEHLHLGEALAENFSILDGNVSFTIPDVPESDDYVIVLFGDSGNASPKFNIVHA